MINSGFSDTKMQIAVEDMADEKRFVCDVFGSFRNRTDDEVLFAYGKAISETQGFRYGFLNGRKLFVPERHK